MMLTLFGIYLAINPLIEQAESFYDLQATFIYLNISVRDLTLTLWRLSTVNH